MSIQANKKIDDAISNIKSFSKIIQQAIGMVDSNDKDSREIASVLKRDPLLSARLLSIANSPFYGMSGKVDDIESACVILGNNIIRNILISAGALDSFPATVERKKIWSHSLEVATVSEYLAKELHQDQGRAYMVGLLHDVGKFILLDSYPEHKSVIEAEHIIDSVSAIEKEMNVMGINHAQAGEKITSIWNLPGEIQELIGKHHNPEEYVESSESALLSLADDMCHLIESDIPENEIVNSVNNNYLKKLGANRKGIEALLPEMKSKILRLDGVFDHL